MKRHTRVNQNRFIEAKFIKEAMLCFGMIYLNAYLALLILGLREEYHNGNPYVNIAYVLIESAVENATRKPKAKLLEIRDKTKGVLCQKIEEFRVGLENSKDEFKQTSYSLKDQAFKRCRTTACHVKDQFLGVVYGVKDKSALAVRKLIQIAINSFNEKQSVKLMAVLGAYFVLMTGSNYMMEGWEINLMISFVLQALFVAETELKQINLSFFKTQSLGRNLSEIAGYGIASYLLANNRLSHILNAFFMIRGKRIVLDISNGILEFGLHQGAIVEVGHDVQYVRIEYFVYMAFLLFVSGAIQNLYSGSSENTSILLCHLVYLLCSHYSKLTRFKITFGPQFYEKHLAPGTILFDMFVTNPRAIWAYIRDMDARSSERGLEIVRRYIPEDYLYLVEIVLYISAYLFLFRGAAPNMLSLAIMMRGRIINQLADHLNYNVRNQALLNVANLVVFGASNILSDEIYYNLALLFMAARFGLEFCARAERHGEDAMLLRRRITFRARAERQEEDNILLQPMIVDIVETHMATMQVTWKEWFFNGFHTCVSVVRKIFWPIEMFIMFIIRIMAEFIEYISSSEAN